jgi:serine/threonine protein phosphatase PrpC
MAWLPIIMAFQVMLYQVSVYCISDIGLIRQNNEDSWKLLKDEQFLVLADGMGGHQAGEVASKEAVERLCFLFQQRMNLSYKAIAQAERLIKELIQEVNIMIYRLGRENPNLRGMGTTLCCLFFHPEGLIYGHVGDSRIYRFSHGQLKQLTRDHSLLRELIELGQLSEQQAEDFLYKNIITKAIGTEPNVEPAIAHIAVEAGDIFLMCTDGLSDLVCFEEIQEVLQHSSSIAEAASLLVKKAKQKGGYDNITVILVKVKDKYESNLS